MYSVLTMGKNNMLAPQRMPLGKILEEAGLVSSPQIEVALLDQMQYEQLMLGEILALHGWLKQETADFFAARWYQICQEKQQHPLGQYLKEAALLDEEQITHILKEQERTLLKFGKLAVMKGYIKQQTVNFFIDYLSSENREESQVSANFSLPMLEDEKPFPKEAKVEDQIRKNEREQGLLEAETYILQEYLDDNDFIWIG